MIFCENGINRLITIISNRIQIRSAVDSVRVSNGLGPDIGRQLTEELLNQLSKSSLVVVRDPQPAPSSSAKPEVARPTVRSVDTFADENPLYVITPTYRRPEQVPELTRMAHTLMLVKNVHWLVIEDAQDTTKLVTELLKRTGLKFEHLVGKH